MSRKVQANISCPKTVLAFLLLIIFEGNLTEAQQNLIKEKVKVLFSLHRMALAFSGEYYAGRSLTSTTDKTFDVRWHSPFHHHSESQ